MYDMAKGAAILFIVLGHVLLPVYKESPVSINLYYVTLMLGMGVFCFVSGVMAHHLYRPEFQWKKLWYILYLYLFYKLILYFVEPLAWGAITDHPYLLFESGAPWYLLTLFFWYLGLPLLQGSQRTAGSVVAFLRITVLCLLLGYLGFLSPQLNSFLASERLISYYPFFAAGYLMGEKGTERLVRKQRRALILFLFFFILLFGIGSAFVLRDMLAVSGVSYYRLYRAEGNVLERFPWTLRLLWYLTTIPATLGLMALCQRAAENHILRQRRSDGADRERRNFALSAGRAEQKKEEGMRGLSGEGRREGRIIRLLSLLGRNSLSVYILHRPIRDLLMFLGLYRRITVLHAETILGLCILSFFLSVLLALPPWTKLISGLSELFDRFWECVFLKKV